MRTLALAGGGPLSTPADPGAAPLAPILGSAPPVLAISSPMANILYVDDEPAMGLILQGSLERLGPTAIGAQNVPEALAALAKGEFDLIISDFRMPGLSGLEFLEVLRDQGRDIPLIMLTGYAT